jgi:hypothetical protein
MAEPVGSDRAMRVASSLRATGKVIGGALTTTIVGIGTAPAITTVDEIEIGIGIGIAAKRLIGEL